uniref:Mobile element protein n=1 Tax=Enterobacter cloacae TaxID=550 RepID=A0A2S1JHS3_ENTCL|nr:Mobile element protein [Enterobacter cloacae]
MAPDDKHDLISGTCSHLPYKLDKLQNDIWRWSDLRRTILICKVVA